MGLVLNTARRNWQAECIYKLFVEHQADIEQAINAPNGIFRIENFENGRERGYTVKLGLAEVSFAEHRSSDDIVVYPFKWANASEDDYDTKTRHFKYQQFQETFEWILDYLGIKL